MSKRVAKPTGKTPATFVSLNWEHSDCGPADPTPKEGVVTLMGPAVSAKASGVDCVPALRTAVDILRKDGFSIQFPNEYAGYKAESL